MKIFICADVEGTAGIAAWPETELGAADSAYFRAQMSREVAAACRGALEGGAQSVLVKDAHDSARNIDPAALPEQAELLRGWARNPYVMMAGLDGSFDGAFYTGCHSGAGSDGNPLAHTMNLGNNYVLINGLKASELYINMLSASYLGVPSLLATGDEALCAWAAQFNPGMETVAVSRGVGGASASINPALAQRRIQEAARRALDKDASRLKAPLPDEFNVEINFKEHAQAYRASFYPGMIRHGVHNVSFRARDWFEVLRTLFYVL